MTLQKHPSPDSLFDFGSNIKPPLGFKDRYELSRRGENPILKKKSDKTLLLELKTLIDQERELTVQVIEYFREVEVRRLHLEQGYSTLFAFATEGLGYSEGSAHRRISAMLLTKALPEMKEKLQSGELSLTVAAKAQNFFRLEEKRLKEEVKKGTRHSLSSIQFQDTSQAMSATQSSPPKTHLSVTAKREILSTLMGASTRECERKLAAISPETARPKETARLISGSETLIQFVADAELMEKLERLKGLMAHKNWDGKYSKLFHDLADIALKKFDPGLRSPKKSSSKASRSDTLTLEDKKIPGASPQKFGPECLKSKEASQRESGDLLTSPQSALETRKLAEPPRDRPSRYIPNRIRVEVWKRDQGKCTHQNVETGKACGSRHALQYDHIQPVAMNGPTSPENLRLLCWNHHQQTTRGLLHLLE